MAFHVLQDEPTVVSHDPTRNETWERSGACNRCGQCCEGCEYLVHESDGTTTCSGRTSQKYLVGCNVFPQYRYQADENPKCSYRFRRVD